MQYMDDKQKKKNLIQSINDKTNKTNLMQNVKDTSGRKGNNGSSNGINLLDYSKYNPSQKLNEVEKQKKAASNAVSNYDPFKTSKEYNTLNTNANNFADLVSNYGDFVYGNQAQYDDIMNKILNREQFSYDMNADALYQQYKDKYMQQGKMAMQDTMGQAAAMTGGYGNSYAAMVGNQAYQSSLNNLNDVIPELYQMAYDRYRQEGQDLYNQYGMLADERNTQYGMYNDKFNRYANNRDYYTNASNNQWNRDYAVYQDEYGRLVDTRNYATDEYNNAYGQEYGEFVNDRTYLTDQDRYDQEWEYNTSQDTKDNARQDAYGMLQMGVMPSADVLAKAGISQADADAIIGKYNDNVASENNKEAKNDAATLVYGMLEMGVMPSADVLAKAGISQDDADAIIGKYNDNVTSENNKISEGNARQDAYNMLQMGVMPSADVLAKAGISQADADAIIKKYNDNVASDNYWRQMEYDYDTGVRNQSNARQDAYAMMQIGLMPSAPMLQAAGISANDAKLISDRYANAGTGSITGLQPSEYNDVMDSVEGYVASGDTDGLGSYLNGLVNRGWISEDEAADLWDTYVGVGEFEETDTNVDLTEEEKKAEEEKKKKKTDGGGFVGNPSRLDRTQGKTYY